MEENKILKGCFLTFVVAMSILILVIFIGTTQFDYQAHESSTTKTTKLLQIKDIKIILKTEE